MAGRDYLVLASFLSAVSIWILVLLDGHYLPVIHCLIAIIGGFLPVISAILFLMTYKTSSKEEEEDGIVVDRDLE